MFADYDHIERINEALWCGQAYGRAAIMVGAGLSLNATPASASTGPFPTWAQLAARLVDALYPIASTSTDEREFAQGRGKSISGALRLADEFQAAYGRPQLDELLLKAIPDANYDPGPLHRLLLKLPWADVFTTNYDRLLERAASTLTFRRYGLVTNSVEISCVMRPRIVKLHGSFPSGRPFIITEEDFRTYPRKFAPMVNLVQQAIIENILVLIGFSGDDPNFLNWTGWARDNLGEQVRQIYLCGILHLTSAQRKLLERRHVVPIDLSPLFPQNRFPDTAVRHSRALEWLLLCLEAGQPTNPLAWPRGTRPVRTTPSADLPAILTPTRHDPRPERRYPR